MKQRIISYLILVIALLMKPLLSCAQNNASEENIVKFDKKSHDFGDIMLSDGSVSCKFTFTNVSDKPVVVHNVVSSCGCTVPKWTKQPVLPSDKGVIDVTYNNDSGPVPFSKTITVYISGLQRPVVLRIKGNVLGKKMSIEELYPFSYGSIALRKDSYDLGYIAQGKSKSDDYQIVNTTSKPVKVTFNSPTEALQITVEPNPIPAKGEARMVVNFNTAKGPQQWGVTSIKAYPVADGIQSSKALEVKATINDNFESLSDSQKDGSPVALVKINYFEFGETKKGNILSTEFTISNKGKKPLVIHKADPMIEGVTVETKCPLTIKGGSSTTLKVKFDTSYSSGEVVGVISLITNSPSRPIVNLFLTGYVL